MAKPMTALFESPSGEQFRCYFENTMVNNTPMVAVWSKDHTYGYYRVNRYGSKLSRAWIQNFSLDAQTPIVRW